jgi:5'-nucleotidase
MEVDPLRILLTNDDGIYAPGLYALYKSLKDKHLIDIVAPDGEVSAVGHGITLSAPLRVREARRNGDLYGYAVNGTPADCVKMAVQELLGTTPDMVVSGINAGANVGVNVLYSGTVSAATEGAFLGLRAAAVSLDARVGPDFSTAASLLPGIVAFLENIGDWPEGVALNINIPAVPASAIAGIAVVRQATLRFKDRYERRTDPRGRDYYWLAGEEAFCGEGAEDTDVYALKRGMITITPIHYDLTCNRSLADFGRRSIPKVKDLLDG